MSKNGPRRSQSDLADMVEMLLDKGVVINADVAVSVGDTELLGVEIRAAVASFETAAKYGLEFPGGTDMDRVDRAASGRAPIDPERNRDTGEREATDDGGADDRDGATAEDSGHDHLSRRPNTIPTDEETADDGD